MTRKNVYLDNAATTPMDPKVIEKISSEMTNDFGNASSQHAFGRKARQVVEAARHQLAETINAEDKEIILLVVDLKVIILQFLEQHVLERILARK